jgi:integrase
VLSTFESKKVQKSNKYRLTDLGVRNLKEIGVYWDDLPGFGIRVGKTRKTWFVMHGKARLRTTIGQYPNIAVADARKKALALLGAGGPEARAISFPDARQEFLVTQERRLRPRSFYQQKRTLERHFTWSKPLDKITHRDITSVVEGLLDTPSQAAHCFKEIRTFFRWCVPRYLTHSPCEGLKTPAPDLSRTRVLNNAELKAVWNAAGDYGYPFGTIVQLLILTGARRGEMAAMQADWIEGDCITFPASITKNGRQHTIPIATMTQSTLATLPKEGLLFPARRSDKAFSGFGASKEAFDERCKIAPWTLHDLRRTFATNLAALGTPIHITEKLLNHVSGTTGGLVAVYQRHSYMDEMRKAVHTWERRLSELLA